MNAMAASAIGCGSGGCATNAPSPVFGSRVDFQTVAVGLPSGAPAAGDDDAVRDGDRRCARARLPAA